MTAIHAEWCGWGPASDYDDSMSWAMHTSGHEAWLMAFSYFGVEPDVDILDPVDFGSCTSKMLGLMDRGEYLRQHVDPCFAGGHSNLFDHSIIDALAADEPHAYYLLGVIPWKVFEINYIPVERHPRFLVKNQPRIDELTTLAAQIRESPNPRAAYEDIRQTPGSVTEDFFDTL